MAYYNNEVAHFDGRLVLYQRSKATKSADNASKREPPHLNWSTAMFRKRRTENGEQATEAGRDSIEVTAS